MPVLKIDFGKTEASPVSTWNDKLVSPDLFT